jgi:hypothetical protein
MIYFENSLERGKVLKGFLRVLEIPNTFPHSSEYFKM